MLRVKNLSFSFEGRPLLDNLCFTLKRGEIVSLIGRSGSGKSTFFRLLTALLKPEAGEIKLGSQPAYMMQSDLLLPWRTVKENVSLPTELGSGEKEDLAKELIEEVGLAGFEGHYPEMLSGGMRQRAALARTLNKQRKLLLLDEPFGALDVAHREQMYALLRKLREKWEITIFMITHDFRDAMTLSDTIYLLSDGAVKKNWPVSDSSRDDPELIASLRSAIHCESALHTEAGICCSEASSG